MKNLLLSVICILISFSIFSQIPNASFEEWEEFGFYDKPIGWETNQDNSFARIIKDSLFKVDGQYSLQFVSNTNFSSNCNCLLISTFVFNDGLGENKSLYFYLKLLSISADDDFIFFINLQSFKDGSYLGNDPWLAPDEYEEFELVEIPLSYPDVDSIKVIIKGGAANQTSTTFCENRSVSWIDGLEIKDQSPTSISNLEKSNIEIFPNPSFGEIKLKGDVEKYRSFKIYDLYGRELENGRIDSPSINLNSNGILLLVLQSKTGLETIFKISVF